MSRNLQIGFIGLGNVGGKLAGSLLRNNFDLTVRDIDENLTNLLKNLGAKVAKSPKELAQYLKESNVKVHPGIRRTLGKIIPPLAVALTMVGVAEAASSPLEEYELGPEDQNILTRITDPFIGDDPAKRKAARLFEETYSPFPFTVVKRKGEDVVPLDQTIGEQMRKLKDKIGPDYKESEEKIAEEEAKKDIPKEVYVPDLAIMQSDLENF